MVTAFISCEMSKNTTVIFFKGLYDTLDLFSAKLIEVFEEWGYGIFVYNTADVEGSKQELLTLLCNSVTEQKRCVVITFNNMGYNLEENGVNVWERYEIPYINILMDHPFHFERPLREASGTSIVLCTDRNHVKYLRRYYKNIQQVDFLPHAGIELGRKHKVLKDRKIDVLYAGALPIYTVADMIPSLDEMYGLDLQDMMQDVLRDLVTHSEKTTEQAIEEYVQSVGRGLSEEELRNVIIHMRFLDSYATSFFREQAVRILVENGIHVTAYGVGWDRCEWSSNPYLNYGGKVMAPQILPLMNDSKVVLNTMTWFKAGAHDRIFNGMLAGAAVVSDDSTYLQREFTDGKELVLFRRNELMQLPERVYELFGHMDKAQEMADCGYLAAKECHTWKNRAEYIVECYL